MPSAAAVEAFLRRKYPHLKETQIKTLSKKVAALIIPKEVHQKISQTYGWRNQPDVIEKDSQDLRAALDRNLDAIKSALKEAGATDDEIEAAREKMHSLNDKQGLYK
ncbi:hypothetical protein OWC53_12990 [Pectobacterium brasiliense]|nr:hypothetical protein [Pectobacterium brasiliense]WGL26301.1 hypothetical protein OWC53_12990 [Pectobacterium brasiliense]